MSLTIFLSPIIGVPLLLLAGVIGAFGWFRTNTSGTGRMNELREQVPYESGTDFTARDQTTLTPTERQ